jgi:hypothetical protein
MRFDHPTNPDIWLTVKETPKNRDVLLYDGATEWRPVDTLYPRLWAGVKWLVDEWHCDLIDLDAKIDEIMDANADIAVVKVIKWAGLVVFSYRQSLEPEKN